MGEAALAGGDGGGGGGGGGRGGGSGRGRGRESSGGPGPPPPRRGLTSQTSPRRAEVHPQKSGRVVARDRREELLPRSAPRAPRPRSGAPHWVARWAPRRGKLAASRSCRRSRAAASTAPPSRARAAHIGRARSGGAPTLSVERTSAASARRGRRDGWSRAPFATGLLQRSSARARGTAARLPSLPGRWAHLRLRRVRRRRLTHPSGGATGVDAVSLRRSAAWSPGRHPAVRRPWPTRSQPRARLPPPEAALLLALALRRGWHGSGGLATA